MEQTEIKLIWAMDPVMFVPQINDSSHKRGKECCPDWQAQNILETK